MSVEVLWQRYQHWHAEHDQCVDNISTLSGIDEKDYDRYVQELGLQNSSQPHLATKKRIKELIKDNDNMIVYCTRKMRKIGHRLEDEGVSVDAFHHSEAMKEANEHEDEEWVKDCDDHLESIRPCARTVDSVVQRIPLGASGFKGFQGDDDDEEVDVLDDDDDDESVASELSGVGRINYFRDEDDANEVEDAFKTDDVAIKIGKSYLKPAFALLLKPHQREATIAVLKQLGSNEAGFLLAHAMGLGKTLTTIATLQALSKSFKYGGKFLVVCPKSLLHSWFDEFGKWDENLSLMYHPPIEDDKMSVIKHWSKKGGVLVMTHDRFRRYQLNGVHCFNPDVLVVDEAHNLRNQANQFYKAVESIETKRKLLLTGTPLQNHLMEYYTMLALISPSLFDESQFKAEYAQIIDKGAMADANDEDITAAKTKIKVFGRLTEGIVHRRSVAVLAHALPPMTDYKLTYTIPEDMMPNTEGMGGFEKTYAIATAAMPTKLGLAKKLIKQIRKTGDLTLVFSKSTEVVKAMSKKLDCLSMTGLTPAATRKALIEDFMTGTSGSTEFCMTTQVGGLGLNLQKANRIIILDPTWNPVIDRQACFRAYRYGQVKPVFIYRFIVEDSIEERIYRCAVHKSLAACRVIDEQDVERIFTKAQLFAKDDFEENVLNKDAVQDQALNSVMDQFSQVAQHDVLFAEANHEKLTDEELADADNEYNKIIYHSETRTLTHPVTQLQQNIAMDDLFFPTDDDGEDEILHLVPPAVPIWKKSHKGFALLQFQPVSDGIDQYVMELEMSSPGGGIQSRTRDIAPGSNTSCVTHIRNKGTCRLRVKMTAAGVESDWSGWSALMYS